MRRFGAVLATLVLAACSSPTAPTPVSSPPPSGYVRISTLSGVLPPGVTSAACAGVGYPDVIVHGDPDASVKVWLEPISSTAPSRIDAIWPAGFVARFTPRLELLDASGKVVVREGDVLKTVGGSPRTDTEWALWEFNGLRYPCY